MSKGTAASWARMRCNHPHINRLEAIHWSEKALDLGQRLEDAEVISHASNTLGVSMARRGKLDEGIARK